MKEWRAKQDVVIALHKFWKTWAAPGPLTASIFTLLWKVLAGSLFAMLKIDADT